MTGPMLRLPLDRKCSVELHFDAPITPARVAMLRRWVDLMAEACADDAPLPSDRHPVECTDPEETARAMAAAELDAGAGGVGG